MVIALKEINIFYFCPRCGGLLGDLLSKHGIIHIIIGINKKVVWYGLDFLELSNWLTSTLRRKIIGINT